MGVTGLANLEGREQDQKTRVDVQCPIHFYEASIAAQAILSYDWLSQHNFVIIPRKNQLEFRDAQCTICIQGMNSHPRHTSAIRKANIKAYILRPETPNLEQDGDVEPHSSSSSESDPAPANTAARNTQSKVTPSLNSNSDSPDTHPDAPDKNGNSIPPSPKPPPCLLDLFSATGSVGDVFRQRGYDVISVDIDKAFKPTIVANILTWEYKSLWTKGYFTVIASSPPCTEYSTAMTRRPRRYRIADCLVLESIDIVQHLAPLFWFMENPRKGHLKTRPFMQDIPYVDIEYCQFSDWGYQKPTRI